MTVTDWLLDSDPAIRWQVLRDLTETPAAEVAAERAKVATHGWGARLLAARDPDGQWAGGAHFPGDYWDNREKGKYPDQPWTATAWSLWLLREYGIDPQHEVVQQVIAQIRENSRWEHDGQRFFDGEVEACINGRLVSVGVHFGQDVNGVVDRLFRRKSTGEVIDEAWLSFAYPPYWQYDLLRALAFFADAGAPPDPRVAEAVDVVRSHRAADGAWLLERVVPGDVHVTMEDEGGPSRWNTLRALRVLAWYDSY